MTPTRREFACGALACATFSGAGHAAIPDPQTVDGSGIDLKSMDQMVAPGDDFYRYVNGKWLQTTQIPADQSRWAEFNRLAELNAQRNRALLEAAVDKPSTPEETKLGHFYASLMDEAGVEARGIVALQSELSRIAAIATTVDLARALAQQSRDWLRPVPLLYGALLPAFITAQLVPDLKNPSRYLPALSQGGIGLPDRDYYFKDGFEKQRIAYKAHLVAMFRLANFDDPEARAARVYALEERIAKAHISRQEMRDVEKRYNIFSKADLSAKAPGLDWDAFLAATGFGGRDVLMVAEPSAVAGVAEAAAAVPLTDWRDYFSYHVIRIFAPLGPRAFVDEDFAFESHVLTGTPELPARWKRAGATIDRAMGHALGRIYMAQYFPPSARVRTESMVRNIMTAMGRRIQRLSWMSPATKARALAKLAAVRIEVGGQNPLRTYDALTVASNDAFGNVLRAARLEYQRDLDRLDGPVDRSEWSMVPQTVNAESNPILRKIMFPAGIMQGLFFNQNADAAVNYGAIGVVMGHELSHHFDDQGSKFDEHGALNNWWTPDDLGHFKAATEALAQQYDSYAPLPGMHINGHLTLGENAADLAGLALARDAYYVSLGGKPAPVIGGLTADQRVFMSYAQVYRTLAREDYLRRQITTDPHSPGEWRAAQVRNMDEWYEAFAVTPGQRQYLEPEQRVKIW